MRLKFYIAHRITDRHYIRDTFCPWLRKLGLTPINPFYTASKKPRKARLDISHIDAGTINPYSDFKTLDDAKDIVTRDLNLIKGSEGIICVLNNASIGTAMELFYCAYVLRKPIFVFTEKYVGHPWLVTFTQPKGALTSTLHQLKKALLKYKGDQHENE